jgi:hypothetical protein
MRDTASAHGLANTFGIEAERSCDQILITTIKVVTLPVVLTDRWQSLVTQLAGI